MLATTEPSGSADQLVVPEAAAVGVELPSGGQRDGVHPALGVGQLDPVARPEAARGAARAPVGGGRHGRRSSRQRPGQAVGSRPPETNARDVVPVAARPTTAPAGVEDGVLGWPASPAGARSAAPRRGPRRPRRPGPEGDRDGAAGPPVRRPAPGRGRVVHARRPGGRTGRSTTTSCAASACGRRRRRRTVAVDRRRRRPAAAVRRRVACGPALRTGRSRIASAGALPEHGPRPAAARRRSTGRARRRPQQARTPTRPAATTRPRPPGDQGAGRPVPGQPARPVASSTRPPSSGRPGQRVEAATSAFAGRGGDGQELRARRRRPPDRPSRPQRWPARRWTAARRRRHSDAAPGAGSLGRRRRCGRPTGPARCGSPACRSAAAAAACASSCTKIDSSRRAANAKAAAPGAGADPGDVRRRTVGVKMYATTARDARTRTGAGTPARRGSARAGSRRLAVPVSTGRMLGAAPAAGGCPAVPARAGTAVPAPTRLRDDRAGRSAQGA